VTAAGQVTIGQRQIFILPTRHGIAFALILLALLLAAINYGNALAYLLTFLLAGMAIVSLLHTQRNLLGLTVTVTGADPVFVGEPAAFHVCLANTGRERLALRVESKGLVPAHLDLPARDTRCATLAVPAARRGWLDCPRFVLASHYPLGITRAWTRRVHLPARCLVYPRPADDSTLNVAAAVEGEGSGSTRREGEDFAGLRSYQPGDSPARISWKTLARGQGLHTKDFSAPAAESVWLDWEQFAPHDTETRLSLLTRALLEAEDAGLIYGLRLPGRAIDPDNGPAHRHRCLEALALHDLPPPR
jgi:uncharacterized protein (DUF58 family)